MFAKRRRAGTNEQNKVKPVSYGLVWVLTLGIGACTTLKPVLPDPTTIGNLIVQGVPEIPDALVERMQQYRNTRSARLLGWLPEGLLISTRFAQTGQLHRVRSPLGAREQVTFFDEPVTRAYVPPSADVNGFVYARDIGGSEFYQLFWFDWQTGQSRLLTDGKSRYTGVVWANGADRFAYTTTERDGRHWDIHIQDLEGNLSIALETDSGAWGAIDWAPGDDRLLVDRYLSINESYLYELDLTTATLTPLLDESIKASIGPARYNVDGSGVYFTSDLGAEFMRLHYLDLDTRRIEVLTAEIPWNVEGITLSGDGEHLAFTINEGGYSRLHVWHLPDHTPLALSELPRGAIFGLQFSPDGRHLGLGINRSTAPADIYSLDIVERTTTRWTRSEVGGLDPQGLTEPELVSYPTFDTVDGRPREIPAFIYRPQGDGPHPVLINIHGGPEGQSRPYFSASVQYFVNELGIAVIAPNVRGSNGYGKSYLQLDNGYLREDSVKDIGSLLDWIATDSTLDADRVAVMGGSYGGYMVLASMTHYSDRLAAGIERVGISNFVTFLKNTQQYRRDLRRAEYGDERIPQMKAHLENISPLNHVDRITKPLMISQGFNDPRVPASESVQILEALQEANVPVWYVLAMDEGHGFSKKVNADYNAAATVMFLNRYLLK